MAKKELTDAQALAGATLAIAASNLAAAIVAKKRSPSAADAIEVWRDLVREMQKPIQKTTDG